ncbi:MAG: PqqD family protein [Candidatus Omnitrophota bacterium]
MENKIYRLSDNYSLFKGDFKEKRFQLFNIADGTIYKLNEVSYDMLSLFDGERNIEEIFNRLITMYDIEPEQLKQDFYTMVNSWLGNQILI